MISVEGLSVEFGVKPLFSDASFVVNSRDRIALVGKNGAGKSTLLKLLCGQERPTSGKISVGQGVTMGYLPQVMSLQDSTTVREETMKAFDDVSRMRRRLSQLEQQMNDRTDYESAEYMELVERFTIEHERLQMSGPEQQEAELERVLAGLGFDRPDLERPTGELSGGWRMRIELAKILLKHPDVLLLDEPTNHLDIESIQWLEQLLATWSGAVVLVSHDRAFINNVSSRTLEISCGHIIDYKVKYNEYVVLRRERREQQLHAYENQQKEMADMRQFIERFRYQATKAIQVQQKIRQLEKMVPIEIDEVDNRAIHLKFPPCLRSGDYPVICEDVAKSYGDHEVFSQVSLTVKRGEKVAFVGRNGEGKTTLVKCIMGEVPFEGRLQVGHNVKIGYFAQNQAQLLDECLTVYQTIDYVATGEVRLRINDLLGAFMFGGEASEKKVAVLSGGERSRLAMIRLLLEPVNLLILDEPTNHLDMVSKDVLKDAIRAFDGTAIIVSHDREFLDGLVTKVYEFGDGRVREHIGGIYDFLQKKKMVELSELNRQSPSSTKVQIVPMVSSKSNDYTLHKEQQKQLRKAERAVEESEKKIARMEQRLKELDQLFMNPEYACDMTLVTEYTDTKRQLDQEVETWEELSEALDQLTLST